MCNNIGFKSSSGTSNDLCCEINTFSLITCISKENAICVYRFFLSPDIVTIQVTSQFYFQT